MIALGVGVHQWTAQKCMEKYETIINNGLDVKLFTKTWGFGWVARWIRQSIYLSQPLEKAMSATYGNERLFSLRTTPHHHTTRVAITTTVEDKCKLMVNYRRGGVGQYLDSTSLTWQA
jgi:hypothetical protein